MAKCKFCGKSVQAATVWHSACWVSQMEKIAQVFCDKFCRWPDICRDEEELSDNHCDKDCPLIEALNAGL